MKRRDACRKVEQHLCDAGYGGNPILPQTIDRAIYVLEILGVIDQASWDVETADESPERRAWETAKDKRRIPYVYSRDEVLALNPIRRSQGLDPIPANGVTP